MTKQDVIFHWNGLNSIPLEEIKAYRLGKADGVPQYADDLAPLLPISTLNIDPDWPIWADGMVMVWVAGCVSYSIFDFLEGLRPFEDLLVENFLLTTHYMLQFSRADIATKKLNAEAVNSLAEEKFGLFTLNQRQVVAYALSLVRQNITYDFEGSLADGFDNFWRQYLLR